MEKRVTARFRDRIGGNVVMKLPRALTAKGVLQVGKWFSWDALCADPLRVVAVGREGFELVVDVE